MRATLDTNVFVSALQFGGIPGRLLDLSTDERFVVCISQAIIAELNRVLKDRFQWTEEDIETILTPISCRAHLVEPNIKITASSDPDDNRILECALVSKSDAIVAGDDHLLRLGTFEGIPIMTPRDFYESMLRME
jgi:uncharacterized protein